MKKITMTLAFALISLFTYGQISLNQTDDFEGFTTENWTKGSSSNIPNQNITTGGPDGTDDNFLRIESTGTSGPDSKLVTFNNAQWQGNYISAGVTYISMDVRNSGSNTIFLRVAFQGPFSNSLWSSTNAIAVRPGEGWQTIVFPIDEDSLTDVGSSGESYADTFSDINEIRLLHNDVPDWQGDVIAATLDVDNITATNDDMGLADTGETGISLNLVDDFEGFTTENWTKGSSSNIPNQNITTGGPDGTDDNFLRIESTGTSGPDSKLVTFNNAQWQGNYVDAAITHISMDVRNSGSNTIFLRVAFQGPFSNSLWSSTNPIAVIPGEGWKRIEFPIDESSLTDVGSSGESYTDTFSNINEIRLLHNDVPDWQGDVIEAILDVDNIQALNNSADIIFPESFETSVPPTGWTSFRGTNGEGSTNDWETTAVAFDGNQAAYIQFEDVANSAQDWLVTPKFVPSATDNYLSFYQRQTFSDDWGSTYTIRVSTDSQTDHSDFVIIDTQTESDFGLNYTEHLVDLSAYEGVPIYVAFVMEQDDGDDWFIDYVDLIPEPAPLCTPTTNSSDGDTDYPLTFSGDTFLFWDAPTSGATPDGYEIFIGTESGNLTSAGNWPQAIAYIQDLEYNTTYYWRAVPFNSGGSASGCTTEWSFTTEAVPPTFSPFFQEDFNGSSFPEWQLASGDYGDPLGFSDSSFGFRADDFANNPSNSQAFVINIWPNPTTTYIITPKFNLSGDTYYLNFDIALTPFQAASQGTFGTGDYVALLVTQNDGDTWAELTRWDASSTVNGAGQAANEITLSGYGNNVRFAFYGFSGSSADNDFFIDNFTISDTTTSAEDTILSGIKVYPTIVDDILNIDSDKMVDNIGIYDLLGKQVFSSKPNTRDLELNLSRLKAGVYMVRLQIENSIGTYKIVKQ